MDKADAKDGDIIIKLGRTFAAEDLHFMAYPHDIDYNVSHFLRRHDSSANKPSREWEANFNKSIDLLDAKVHIDPSDPRYSHIYKGIDIIVKRLVAELARSEPFYENVKLRRTGSSMSGVKVGLPHESDYVMVLSRSKQLKTGKPFSFHSLFPLVQQIIAEQAAVLTEGLSHWIIHGVKEHAHIGGVCLVMQCLSSENDLASDEVGVTVDLVPVYIMETTTESLNEKAAAYLPFSLDEYATNGELYRLVDNTICDTGFIENCIIEQLPEDTKRDYRVAKYLISTLFTTNEVQFDQIKTLDAQTRHRLYGCDQNVSSYRLRVFFLHLLLHVHATEAKQRLRGGLLVLYLRDMLEFSLDKNQFTLIYNHPLLKDREDYFCCSPFLATLNLNLMWRLLKTNHADLFEELALINQKKNFMWMRINFTD